MKWDSSAVLSGPIPKVRNIKRLKTASLTRGEKIVRFAHNFLVVPEGLKVGQPLELDVFQIAFILSIFDNPAITNKAILSLARRNGKTFLVAVILLAFILGPEAVENSTLASAAMSREQAALVFGLMSKMLALSPRLDGLYKIIPSGKRIIGLRKNVEYMALASEAKTGHGKSLLVVLLDESGQISGPHSDYVDMLVTSQGSYADPLFITISTQAPSDADLLSVWIDAAETGDDPSVVCHVYRAPDDCELTDVKAWRKANPALGQFRSTADIKKQAKTAQSIPSAEAGFRNLILNQRVALEGIWLAPTVWKANGAAPDLQAFRENTVALGLDLSAKNDLTAAVIACQDSDGAVHVIPFVFCPTRGIEERARRDRVPYDVWVRNGLMIPLGGDVMDYDQIFGYLRGWFDDHEITPDSIEFDRWRISIAQKAAEDVGFPDSDWHEVGQGFKDFSPRVEAFEGLLLQHRIRHGNHPLLTMAASKAIVVRDPAGAQKLDKSKATTRIDPLIAAVMAVFAVTDGVEVDTMGENVFFTL